MNCDSRKSGSLKRIVLATNNTHKVAEIRSILAGLPIELLTAADFANFPDPEENGRTLEENARIKAHAVHEATGLWSLADDSGLEIDALDGAPGIYSARFSGPQCSFADNNEKILRLMEKIPDNHRAARFRCVAVLACGDGRIQVFDGIIEGSITRSTRGTGGFGYDPIFFVPGLGRTFAETTAEDKNRLSHRGRAFRKVADHLRTLLPIH